MPTSNLNLNALLAQVRTETRIKTERQALRARVAQRTSAEAAADAHARELEKRASLQRALTSADMDAMRFRWLSEHSATIARFAGMRSEELRREIDAAVRHEAALRLAEMRAQGGNPVAFDLARIA